MLNALIKKELLEHLISLRFLVLIVICITLIPLSFFVSFKDYENRQSDFNQSEQINSENFENLQLIDVFKPGFSIIGYLPPSPLTVFVSGLSDTMPQKLEIQKAGTAYSQAGSSGKTILTLAGKIDFMFIIQIVFSLIAILFTFDAICGEKERGTLKASLSNSIPRDNYILGKFLGTIIVLLIPFMISFLGGLVVLIIIGYPLSGTEIPVRILTMALVSIVYISLFSCIGLFVSARVSNSKTAMVYLISTWILLVIVIPEGSDIVSKAVYPVRSEEVVRIEKDMLRQDLELEKWYAMEDIKRGLPQLDYNNPASEEFIRNTGIRNNALNPIRNEYIEKITSGIARIEQDYKLKKDRQFIIALALARISPATLFSKIMTEVAWTGEAAKENFLQSAHAYESVMNTLLFNNIIADFGPNAESVDVEMGISGEIKVNELPRFVYTRSIFAETLGSIGLDIGLMLFYIILLFLLVYVSFLRYDIR